MFNFLSGQNLFDVKEYYLFGKCLSFIMPLCLLEYGPYVISFNFNLETLVFIHEKNNYHGPDSTNKAIAKLGKYSLYPVMFQLHTKIDNCTTEYMKYGDECFYDKMYSLLMNEHNCSVPWLPKKNTICTNTTMSPQAMDTYVTLQNRENGCPSFCTTTDIFLDPPFVDVSWFGDSVAIVKFYFKKIIKNSEEYYLHNELSLFANIGGFLGLMLGYSLVNIRDMIGKTIEYFF